MPGPTRELLPTFQLPLPLYSLCNPMNNYARTIFSKTQDSKLSTFQGMPFLPLMTPVGSTCVSAWIFASISENFIYTEKGIPAAGCSSA